MIKTNRSIICLEGPSAVGKTTICKLLSDNRNIVSEVNLLFDRKGDESKSWYLEKQVERYLICKNSTKDSILDGDVFQPIWYNWACNYPTQFLGKKETHHFYKKNIAEGKITFPGLYIILQTTKLELMRRKKNDGTRRRRNFKKHLSIIDSMNSYWSFLADETPLHVEFIQHVNLKTTQNIIENLIQNLQYQQVDDMQVFDSIENWIGERDDKTFNA